MPATRTIMRLVAAVVAAASIVLTLAACSSNASSPNASTGSPRPTSAHPTTSTPVSRPHTSSAEQKKAAAKAALLKIVHDHEAGSISVAAYDVDTGASYDAGATSGMWTASLYKLFVLEAVLVQSQNAGTELSSSELSLATPAIENSDNVAAYSLFEAAGGNPGLAAAWKQLGLTSSIPGNSDPTLTTTNAQDCITLLKNLVHAGPLNAYSRGLALGLMRNVESDQRWGVGAAADAHTRFANKNGWLAIDNNGPGESDDGLWAVTSAGVVQVRGHQVLLAVLTRHNSDFESGVQLTETLAKQAAAVVRP